MSFRDQLEKKITVDRLSMTVARSLQGPDSGIHFDSQSMRQLLELGPYRHERERDTDLYILENGTEAPSILVLDNGLPIYHTTRDDVLLRKSPTVKEMVSFKNAYKILNDKDVLASKKTDSVRAVRRVILQGLDLEYDAADIQALAGSGRDALERHKSDEVALILRLFAEMLDLTPVPKAFRSGVASATVLGRIRQRKVGEYEGELIVAYDSVSDTLKLIPGPFNTHDEDQMRTYQRVLSGEESAEVRGPAVFDWLEARVVTQKPQVSLELKALA